MKPQDLNLYPYQKRISEWIQRNPFAMIWADVGLGKTVSTLTAIDELIDSLDIYGALVVAPKRIIQTVWRQEARKWPHLGHLTFSLISGTPEQRIAALRRKAEIYLINPEGLEWLIPQTIHLWLEKGRYPPFNLLVIDEITKLKNPQAKRSRALLRLLPYFKRRVGLTGEPAANGYSDLYGQYLIVDGGKRLGTTQEAFRSAFLRPGGYGGYSWIATRTGREQIHQRISDITIELTTEDYLDLPPVTNNLLWVELPPRAREIYDVFERELFASLDSGESIEVVNEASKINKLIQIASGAAYLTVGGPWEEIHKAKMEALQDLVDESSRPILLGYCYRHEETRIAREFPDTDSSQQKSAFLSSKHSESEIQRTLGRWERDELVLLCGHPACLHPKTEVLTEHRGWISLGDVQRDERVFDGVEFVSHGGRSYSGHKEVIEVFGITMTPDHKLWVNGQWEEGQHAGNRPRARREALYKYQGDDPGLSQMFKVRGGEQDPQAERSQAQPAGPNAMPGLYIGRPTLHDQYPDLENLDGDEISVPRDFARPRQEELPRPWNRAMRAMAEVRELLRRYGRRLFGRFDHRAPRQHGAVLTGELLLDYRFQTASQQAQQPDRRLPGGADPSRRVGAPQRHRKMPSLSETQPGDDGGRSCSGRIGLDLQRRKAEKAHVYDLVDCGPRHRFVVRNDLGETFIAKNSMGHGLNLQGSSARSVVWFSLPWSLELYHQLNGRLTGGHRRKTASVIHHILARDTVDEVVWEVLNTKSATQDGLRHAIREYRNRRNL